MDDRKINADLSMADEGSGLSEILGAILRRKWLLLGTITSFLAIGVLVLSRIVPVYTAEGMVLIESQETNFGAMNAVAPGLSGDAASVQSEAYILFSGNLARRVIDKLNLLADPEFQDPEVVATTPPQLATDPDTQEPTEENHEQSVAYKVAADSFGSRLSVQPQDNSRVIAVKFVSESPAKARTIVNTLLNEYLNSRIEAKFESTKRANVWLSLRTAELRDKVQSSEGKVEELRKQYGLLENNDGGTLTSQEMAEINAQLIVARTDRAEAESRLNELKRLVSSASGIRTASGVLVSPLIQRLREQQAQIDRDIAELSTEFGAKHPRMVQLRAQSEDISKKIADEVYKTIDGLQNSASMARARENSLEQRLGSLKEQVANANQNSIAVRAAERDAEANRVLLANLLARQSEAVSQDDLDFQQADARIISYADIPLEPSFPNKIAILGLIFVGSTVFGLLLILLLESLDRGVRSGEDLYAKTGVPSLGFSPLTPSMHTEDTLSVFAAIRHSAFGQSMKTLDWSIKLGFKDKRPKTLMVTSSVPQEGKSTIACCLAYNQAATGSRVLLIDADMRRPSVYKKAGLDAGEGFASLLRGKGLAGVLQGKSSFEDVLVRSGHPNLYIIPAGKESNFDSEMLVSSEAMQKLLARAKKEFDTIVIDTPPVIACADARILSSRVDATIFVVRWGSTKLAVVKLALGQLASAGATFAGAFLSMVDLKNYTTYNYGDVVAYTGDMAAYYSGSPETKDRVVPLVPQQNPAD